MLSMREQTARTIVHSLAGLVWILTGAITLITIWTLYQWRFFTQEGVVLYRGTPVVSAVFNLLLVIVLGASIGWGLWRKKNWARVLGIIFCALVVLDVLVFMFAHPLSWSLLLIIILALVGIWALGLKAEVKALFQ